MTEYLKDGNGTQAAIRAGYATSSAAMHACRLLKNGRIFDEVRAGQKRRLNHIEVTAVRILCELAKVAFFNPARLFDSEGNPLPFDKMPEDTYRAITRVDVKELVEGDRLVGKITILGYAGKLAGRSAPLRAEFFG